MDPVTVPLWLYIGFWICMFVWFLFGLFLFSVALGVWKNAAEAHVIIDKAKSEEQQK